MDSVDEVTVASVDEVMVASEAATAVVVVTEVVVTVVSAGIMMDSVVAVSVDEVMAASEVKTFVNDPRFQMVEAVVRVVQDFAAEMHSIVRPHGDGNRRVSADVF